MPFESQYRAAGVLPYALNIEGEVVYLLAKEDRTRKKQGYVWNNFGGKRHSDENSPPITAIREFMEETAGIFENNVVSLFSNLRKISVPKLWNPRGLYVLYFIQIPYDDQINNKFKSLDRSNLRHLDQTDFAWFPAEEIATLRHSTMKIGNESVFRFLVDLLSSVPPDFLRDPINWRSGNL